MLLFIWYSSFFTWSNIAIAFSAAVSFAFGGTDCLGGWGLLHTLRSIMDAQFTDSIRHSAGRSRFFAAVPPKLNENAALNAIVGHAAVSFRILCDGPS